MHKNDLPSQEFLKSMFNYDAELGCLRWKTTRNTYVKIGSIAGRIHHTGYRYIAIKINGIRQGYKASRLIYKYHTGEDPDICDHINGNSSDDRIENLRSTTIAGNARNMKKSSKNTSGYTGVSWSKEYNKWCAQIIIGGKNKHLGYFANIEDAIAARKSAIEQINKILPEDQRYSNRHGTESTAAAILLIARSQVMA
jgi:hypothetical protein